MEKQRSTEEAEFSRGLDEASLAISNLPDVLGVVTMVFVADREATSGKAVSLRILGQIPCPETSADILRSLLTSVAHGEHSS